MKPEVGQDIGFCLLFKNILKALGYAAEFSSNEIQQTSVLNPSTLQGTEEFGTVLSQEPLFFHLA